VGLVRAVELFLEHDFEKDLKRWERQVAFCLDAFRKLDRVQARRIFPGEDSVLPRGVPRVYLTWDEHVLGVSPEEIRCQLLAGEPSIVVGEIKGGLSINPVVLTDGEEDVVARRIVETMRSKK
jgi:hypothetical protein